MKRYGYFSKLILRVLIFLIISGLCHAQTPERNDSEQLVSIAFSDADIGVFIKFMSELMGENFIVDNRVKGKITIISPSKVSVKEAYKVFESVLEVNGFAAVKSGNVTKIVPASEAETKAVETLMRLDARSPHDKAVTRILPLKKYADPREIKRLLAPLVSKNSVMKEYVPTHTLIITDVYSNIERLTQFLKIIDVPGAGKASPSPAEGEKPEMKLGELSPQNITLPRSEIETEIQAVTALMSQVKMRPHFKDEKPGGLTFSRVKPNSIFSKLGLQSGDTILSINGSPIRSADGTLKFYESLSSSPKVEIQIRRGDQLQNIYYNITE